MRSMTDEQMLAKYGYDAMPYVNWASGKRNNSGPHSLNTFDPRPECIPSRTVIEFAPNGNKFKPAPGYRPSSMRTRVAARPPVNPILSEFRRSAPWNIAEDAVKELTWLNPHYGHPRPLVDATPEQIEHARKVLTRLAQFQGVTA